MDIKNSVKIMKKKLIVGIRFSHISDLIDCTLAFWEEVNL